MHSIIEKLSSFKDNESVSEKTRSRINQLIDLYGKQNELLQAEINTCQKVFDKAQTEIQNQEAEKKRLEDEENERLRIEKENQEKEITDAQETERLKQEQEQQEAEKQQQEAEKQQQQAEKQQQQAEKQKQEQLQQEKEKQKQEQLEQIKNVVWPHEELANKYFSLLTPEIKGKIRGFTALRGKFMKTPSESTKKAAMKVSESIVAEINLLLQKKKTMADEEKKRSENRTKELQLKKQEQEKERKEKQEATEAERKRKEQEELENARIRREEQDRNGEYDNEFLKGFLGQ